MFLHTNAFIFYSCILYYHANVFHTSVTMGQTQKRGKITKQTEKQTSQKENKERKIRESDVRGVLESSDVG